MPWTSNDSDLATYMFLMQTGNTTLGHGDLFVLTKITLVGCGLSIVGSLLCVLLVCYVPIRSDGLFSIGNMCTALLSAQLAFAGAENAFPAVVMCRISAAVQHYLFLAFHCWAFAYSLHLIVKLSGVLQRLRWQRRCVLMCIGWLIPIVIVALTAVTDTDSYKGDKLCWLNAHTHARWAFVGPVIFIAVFNAVVMVVMLFARCLLDTKRDVITIKKIEHLLTTMLSLLPVSSIPWLVGLAPPTARLCHYVFVIVNSAQGLFVLLLHVLLSSHIRALLVARTKGEGEEKGEGTRRDGVRVSKTASAEVDNEGDTRSSVVRGRGGGAATGVSCHCG